MSVGVPGGRGLKMTLWPNPSEATVKCQRTVSPALIIMKLELNVLSMVSTTTVRLVDGFVGSPPPHAATTIAMASNRTRMDTPPMRESQTKQNNAGWTISRARKLAIGFGLALVIAACGSDTSTPVDPTSPDTPVGSYSIMTVNGKTLPAAVIDTVNYKFEILSGALKLTADGKYIEVTRFRETIPDNTSSFVDSTFGTWTRSGTQINLKNGEDPNATSTGTWAGLQMTFVLADTVVALTYVYKK